MVVGEKATKLRGGEIDVSETSVTYNSISTTPPRRHSLFGPAERRHAGLGGPLHNFLRYLNLSISLIHEAYGNETYV